MNAIKAVWTQGQIVPAGPVDWPEGSELVVEPVSGNGEKIGLSEDQWLDDPASIAAWVTAVERIEPLVWDEGEEAENQRLLAEHRTYNVDAVRRQMHDLPDGEGP